MRYKFILFLALSITAFNLCSYGQELRRVKGPNGNWGCIDETGKTITPFMFHDMGEVSEGIARVRITNTWGFIDKTGVIIPARYFSAGDFSEGLARVKNVFGEWGFIDKTGKEVIPFIYDEARYFCKDGKAKVKLDGEVFYIDTKGNRVE